MVIFASKGNKIHRGTINLYSSPLKAYPTFINDAWSGLCQEPVYHSDNL